MKNTAWIIPALILLTSPVITTAQTTASAGGGSPFSNLQPSLNMNYIIAFAGDSPRQGAPTPSSAK